MSLRSGIVLIASLSILAMLAACGGSSSTPSAPGQSSSTLSELNGNYAFSITGTDSNATAPAFFAMTGVFAANGSGGITGGAMDFNDPNVGQGSALAITGGSYSVGSDGRGTAKLSVTSLGNVTLDFVLTSTSHGLVTRFDNGGSGSGSFDLQSSASQTAGSYAFSFAGFNAAAFVNGANSIMSAAGSFTLDGSGNITAGIQDVYNGGTPAAAQPLSGTVPFGSGNAPGAAQLSTPFGTLSFDVYAVSSNHLKLIESDTSTTGLVLAGDAYTQQGASLPSGATVFNLGGVDSSLNPLAAGGLLTLNSDGSISGGTEDLNDIASTSALTLTFSGNYSAVSGGRAVLNLTGFSPATQFAVYPSSGGLLMMETDGLAITSGTAMAQSATSFSTTGGYGFNLSATNGVELDDIAAFTATSSNISGTIDENDQGVKLSPNQTFGGTYSAAVGGRGGMSLQNQSFNANYYVVDSSTVFLIETDVGQPGVGTFLGQSSVGDSASAMLRAAMARPSAGSRPGLKKEKKLKFGK